LFDPLVLNKTVEWFQTAIPEPAPKNIQTILGVHFEEVAEMIATLESRNYVTEVLLKRAYFAVESLSTQLKRIDAGDVTQIVTVKDEVELLDAVCDQIVTATGVGYHFGHDVLGGVDEVNRSNWSKFVDGKPIFDENLKIQKGPSYKKAKLAQFVSKN